MKRSFGMRSSVWGPCGWMMAGCIARNYPENPSAKKRRRMVRAVNSWKHNLPCKICKKHWRKYLRSIRWHENKYDYLANRETFSQFVYRAQCHVESETGCTEHMDYDTWVQKFEFYRAKCKHGSPGCENVEEEVHLKCILQVVPCPYKEK